MPQSSGTGGPEGIVKRFVAMHRSLYASSLGALDAETERLGAMIRAASPDLDAGVVGEQTERTREWTRAEFRAPLSTHFDTLALLGAWIVRDGLVLDDLQGRWRRAQQHLRDELEVQDSDPTLVAAFVLASVHGTFDLDDEFLQRCRILHERFGHDDPTHQTPWLLLTSALLALRPEATDDLCAWFDQGLVLFRTRTRRRGDFMQEAIQLACLSGLSSTEAVDRMMFLRSTPLLPLEPLEAGALCQLSLDADRLNATLRSLAQQLAPFAARGRHEAIRLAVAATLMGVQDPVCRATADVVSYIRVSSRRIERARRGGFLAEPGSQP